MNLHLPRLQSLHHENPTKRISLIGLAWPDIEKALARGHTLKLIHSRLVEDGIRISYSLLSFYAGRLQGKKPSKENQQHLTAATKSSSTATPVDYQPESFVGQKREPASTTPPPRPNVSGPPQKRGLLYPWELNANNSDNEGCFFKERVPDINELFRVSPKSEPATPEEDTDSSVPH